MNHRLLPGLSVGGVPGTAVAAVADRIPADVVDHEAVLVEVEIIAVAAIGRTRILDYPPAPSVFAKATP